MSPTPIGERRTRGVIQTPTESFDDWGQEIESYAPVAEAPVEWVKIEPLSGREFMEGHQLFGGTSARLYMRFRDDLTAEDRFVADDGKVWVFVSEPLDREGRRQEIEVLVARSA